MFHKVYAKKGPTFVLFGRHAFPLLLLGRFHEEREDGPQAEDVDELGTVFSAHFAVERVIQHFQRSVPRHLLLPVPIQITRITEINQREMYQPQHQIHELETLSFEEFIPIRGVSQTGTHAVKQILHHLLFFATFRVLSFENLKRFIDINYSSSLYYSKKKKN